MDGREVSWEAVLGEPRWIEVLAAWDPASQRRLLDLTRWWEEEGSRRGAAPPALIWVGSTPEEVRRLAPPGGDPGRLSLLDGGRLAARLGVEVVPCSLILEPGGRERARWAGYLELPALAARIRALEGGRRWFP